MDTTEISSCSKNRALMLYLVGITIASSLIYGFIFTKPANFLTVVVRSKVYQDYLYSAPLATRWWVIAAFCSLAILYGLGWYIARRVHGPAAWMVVIIGSLVFGILLSYIYPIDASDLFNNILNGRIRSLYHANPFVQVANDFKSDEFFPLVSFSYLPAAYGPVWELLAEAAVRLAGNGMFANVLALKWLPGIFLLASAGVIAGILKRQGSKFILAGVMMFAWNPIVLYEVWGNGHNDIVMVFFILLAVWAMLYKQHTLTILALIAGILVKFIPVLLIPAAGLISLRDLPDLRARIRYVVVTSFTAALLVYFAYRPFWAGYNVLSIPQRTRLFTTSLPAVFYRISIPWLGQNRAAALISSAALILTISFAIWQGWRAYRNSSIYSFPQASFNILAFYLLVTCLWIQQWYSVWLIGLAPVLASGAAQLFAILFGFLAISKQLFLYPLVIWPNPRPPQPRLEIELTLGVLGLPWLLALALLVRKNIPFHFSSRKTPSVRS